MILSIIHEAGPELQALLTPSFVQCAQISARIFSMQTFLRRPGNFVEVLAIRGLRWYNIRVGFCPDGGRLHAYVTIRVFHRRGQRLLRNRQTSAERPQPSNHAEDQRRCAPAFTRRRHRGCGVGLRPSGVGCSRKRKPVPLLHHGRESRHEHTTRRQAARKPAPDTGEAKNLEVHFTHGTHCRCGPAP